ncbi:hypothetical protein Pmani_026296 [Petrolisthes manimaculis]|nr:hypothetical protein Pmani_026711 [Petrolisthes manimaculis]KAK4301505.1 hypothetical protein Pmani_026283 [Petrolisthes manimaculis]KAK4301518.1 hypothetical protein Pmani_026296 [Petrolisthes manimaculis]
MGTLQLIFHSLTLLGSDIMPPKRTFKNEWLSIEDYNQWLERVQGDPTKASCSTCHKEFNAEITTIKRHKV